jgi:hypothetical protein
MHTRKSAGLLAVALVGAIFLAYLAARSDGIAPPAPRTYSFPEGDEPVLVLTSSSTQLPVSVSLKMYASGTATLVSSLRPQAVEMFFTVEEREEILLEIVNGGLLTYDEAVVALEQKRLAGGRIAGNSADTDLPRFTVQFVLLQEGEEDSEPRRISKTIHIFGPGRLADRFPTIRGYVALRTLDQLLSDRARSSGRGL